MPSDDTLTRLYVLHVILPFLLLAVILLHVLDLHLVASAGDTLPRIDISRNHESDFDRMILLRDLLAAVLVIIGLICILSI